jgi:hypothetical protein
MCILHVLFSFFPTIHCCTYVSVVICSFSVIFLARLPFSGFLFVHSLKLLFFLFFLLHFLSLCYNSLFNSLVTHYLFVYRLSFMSYVHYHFLSIQSYISVISYPSCMNIVPILHFLLPSTIVFLILHSSHKGSSQFNTEFMYMYSGKCNVWYRINGLKKLHYYVL